MEWALGRVLRDGETAPRPDGWLRDETGGAVYLRLSTHKLGQPGRHLSEDQKRDIINGAFWLRPPGPACRLFIACTGVVAPEAIAAAGQTVQGQRDIGLLAVTPADRLNAGWHAADRVRALGHADAQPHIERLLFQASRNAAIVRTTDGRPLAPSWIGANLGSGLSEMANFAFRRRDLKACRRACPALEIGDLQPHHPGIRAQAVMRDGRLVDDFLIRSTARTIHICNAPPPSATSAIPAARNIRAAAETL